MQHFKYEHQGKSVTLYPLVCWHLGAEQSDEKFIREHVARIADDPDGRYIYLGDGGECVTKSSKGDIYLQKYSPSKQIDRFAELARPLAGKGLFGVKGNHDRRIERDSGLDFTDALCTKLGIPFLGNAAFMELKVKHGISSIKYNVFSHHGVDSGANTGTKVNAARKLERLVDADAILSAHSHICLELDPVYVAYLRSRGGQGGGGIGYREVRSFVCGCAYDSRVPGYAEEKAYSPIIPAHMGITFYAPNTHSKSRTGQKKITSQIWRAQA